ncbi:MAG: hypothetical protein CMH62_02875 [Nanoarchaeota archaeon]|nr:hypothetical protein [Nanoarchaeota archaeon]|tara:strand:+ start:427 stop:2091 length:1665 start_codon:yes stop_codon:yes gene_type:complete
MNEIVSVLTKKGYLVSDDFIDNIPENFEAEEFVNLIEEKVKEKDDIVVLNKDFLTSIFKKKDKSSIEINWNEFDASRTLLEKGKNKEIYQTFVDILNYDIDEKKKKKVDRIVHSIEKQESDIVIEDSVSNENNVIVLKSYKEEAKKRVVDDFVYYFRKRFEAISGILRSREKMNGVISLNRLGGKKDNERVSVLGMISAKRMTKNDNVMLTIEDFTGEIFLLINKNKMELYNEAKDLCDDEIIGVIGVKSGSFIFVDELVFPEVPMSHGIKKFNEEVYCAFISDLHVGSKHFLTEGFEKFLKWINGGSGNESQKNIANKIKYLFIGGDLVDGVGIYAGQEDDLDLKDIYEQYNHFTTLIKRIPKEIQIIMCPGNHDALRLTEPQPAIGKEYCEELLKMDNVYMVSNPSLVNIHSNENFQGFDVLLYHGASFNYYIDNVDSIRLSGGYKRADLVMQYLMKRRHLAPTHISTSYIPNIEEDCLVIDKVPDFLLTGHIHRLNVGNYRNVSLINASCWIGQTDFMEKVGLIPQPGKVVVANLQTRDVKVLSFVEDGSE